MGKFFANPVTRLVGRAVVAGVAAAFVLLQTTSDWSTAWKAAVVSGVLAACEVFTPLNKIVGVNKGK